MAFLYSFPELTKLIFKSNRHSERNLSWQIKNLHTQFDLEKKKKKKHRYQFDFFSLVLSFILFQQTIISMLMRALRCSHFSSSTQTLFIVDESKSVLCFRSKFEITSILSLISCADKKTLECISYLRNVYITFNIHTNPYMAWPFQV